MTVVVKSDPYPRDFGWVASSRGAERIFRVVDACGRAIFTYRPSAARPVRMGRGRKHTTKRPVGKGSVYVLSEREGRACEGLRRRALPGFQCGRPRGEFWSARHNLQRGVREVTGSGSGREGSRGMWSKVGMGVEKQVGVRFGVVSLAVFIAPDAGSFGLALARDTEHA